MENKRVCSCGASVKPPWHSLWFVDTKETKTRTLIKDYLCSEKCVEQLVKTSSAPEGHKLIIITNGRKLRRNHDLMKKFGLAE